jgi:hypothetical protein
VTPQTIYIASGAARIGVSRGDAVTLQVTSGGLSTQIRLDADLAIQLSDALRQQAQETAWQQIGA